jgi:glyoxylase-like metal-dependent hydrolase (beta-lactamase superfamily II)/ferredoxin
MANRARAYADNQPGGFFVDDTCIDCDTCRQVAPLTFAEVDGHSYVHAQPGDEAGARAAARAALCCPTGSIGGDRPDLVKLAQDDLPEPVAEGIWYCGWTSRDSFGASSWLARSAAGLWMIDAPRWSPRLAERIAGLGGLAGILLTHRDDVADAARYAERFRAPRLIHARDADAVPDAERIIEGDDPLALGSDLTVVPLPGHTMGSQGLLLGERALFSGDHVWWSRRRRALNASREVCWHSWSEQTASMRRLLGLRFDWLLPGHGERAHLPGGRMRAELQALVARMEQGEPEAWP